MPKFPLQDIPSRINVSIQDKATGATVYTHTQILFNGSPASAALLRRSPRVHSGDSHSGTFGLLLEQAAEHSKGGVVGAFSEVRVLRHKGERQIFNRNQPIAADEFGSFLMPEVPALVRNVVMQLSNLIARLLPTAGQERAPSHPALSASEFCKRTAQPTGVFDKLTVGQCQKRGESNIYAYAVGRDIDGFGVWQLEHEADKPLVQHSLDDHMLNRRPFGYGSVVLNLDLTYVLDVEQRPSLFVKAELAAVTVPVFDALKAAPSLKPWVSGRVASFTAATEGAKGFIQSPQKLLHTRSVQDTQGIGISVALIPKMRPLLSVSDTALFSLPSIFPLRQCRVVDVTGLPQETVKAAVLSGVREQTIVVRPNHLAALLRLDVVLYRLFGNTSGRADKVATRPQRRQAGLEVRELLSQHSGGVTLELIGKALGRFGGVGAEEHMNVVGHDFKRLERHVYLCGLLSQKFFQSLFNLANQHRTAVLKAKDEVAFERKYRPAVFAIPSVCHALSVAQIPVSHLLYSCLPLFRAVSPNQSKISLSPKGRQYPFGEFYGRS